MCSPMPEINPEAFEGFDDETYRVLSHTEAEMDRQDERWGQQDHPDIGGKLPWVTRIQHATVLERVREVEAQARDTDTLGWDLILLEEVYEALSELDDDKRCEELTQVAAVALQWAKAIRRR